MFFSSLTRTQRALALLLGATACVAVIVDCGGEAEPLPNVSTGKLQVSAKMVAGSIDSPIDAIPDPLGSNIFFIATSKGQKGIFKVASDGGPVTTVYLGEPLVDPHGLSIGAAGDTLFVADPGADKGGVIFQIPTNGDTPVAVEGTLGLHPTALDLIDEVAGEALYFTGADRAGEPAIFKVPAAGGALSELAHGAPLVRPDGISVTTKQTVFVADKEAGQGEAGQVFQLQDGKLSICGPEFLPGGVGGLSVTLDEKRALVSSLDPQKGTSQVIILDTAAHTAAAFSDVIKESTEAGGMHRARYRNVYAWAGKRAVYSVKIKVPLRDSSTIGGPGD
ncbi:MAG: hypothetical protein U0359_16200 [Byssovorax sp.]